jgi:hypothetical protein
MARRWGSGQPETWTGRAESTAKPSFPNRSPKWRPQHQAAPWEGKRTCVMRNQKGTDPHDDHDAAQAAPLQLRKQLAWGLAGAATP